MFHNPGWNMLRNVQNIKEELQSLCTGLSYNSQLNMLFVCMDNGKLLQLNMLLNNKIRRPKYGGQI
jgi:hypothetical protein